MRLTSLNPQRNMEREMKVKFLKDGRFGHAEPGRGAFDCKIGETMSGLSEVTCRDLKKSKWAKILGEDDPKEDVDEEDEPEKKDATMTTSSMASKNRKPW